jgi:hypothetical protein
MRHAKRAFLNRQQAQSRDSNRLVLIIARARRMKRIAGGLVLCDNCDSPASREYSLALTWTCCGPCATGEAATLDPEDFINAEVA